MLKVFIKLSFLILFYHIVFATEWENLSGPKINGGKFYEIVASPNGDIYASGTLKDFKGIFKLSKDSLNWMKVYSGAEFINMVVSPNGFIYGADYSTSKGVIRSTDFGKSWQFVNEGLSTRVRALAALSDGSILAGTRDGIFKSTNYGNNWFKIMNGVDTSRKGSYLQVRKFYVKSNDVIYAALNHRIYVSKNKGNYWDYVGEITMIEEGESFDNTIWDLAVTDNGSLFAVGIYDSKIYRSLDDGYSWDIINPFNIEQTNNTAGAIATEGNNFYCANRTGIYKSTDFGNHWLRNTNGLPYVEPDYYNQLFYTYPSLKYSAHNKSFYLASIYFGVFHSSDDCRNWNRVGDGLYVDIPTVFFPNKNKIFAVGGNVFDHSAYTNYGNIWTKQDIYVDESKVNPQYVSIYEKDLNNNLYGVIDYPYHDIIKSTDNGQNFSRMKLPLVNNIEFLICKMGQDNFLYALAIDSLNSIYRFLPQTNKWEKVTSFNLKALHPVYNDYFVLDINQFFITNDKNLILSTFPVNVTAIPSKLFKLSLTNFYIAPVVKRQNN